MTKEEWRPVSGYEGYYEVSNLGNVRSLDRYTPNSLTGTKSLIRGRVLVGRVNSRGYTQLKLSVKGCVTTCLVHRLVALAFLGPRPTPKHIVLHGASGQSDNSGGNLRWGTNSENMLDKRRDGTDHEVNKTHCPQGHKYGGDNLILDSKGRRKCRACQTDRNKRKWAGVVKGRGIMEEVEDDFG